MGFNKDRGDTLSLANAPFTVSEKDAGLPPWRDPELVTLAKDLVKYAALGALIAYLLLGVVRPLLKTLLEPPPGSEKTVGSQIDLLATDEGEAAGPEPIPTASELLERKLAEARALAQQDPQVVANIIRQWTGAHAG